MCQKRWIFNLYMKNIWTNVKKGKKNQLCRKSIWRWIGRPSLWQWSSAGLNHSCWSPQKCWLLHLIGNWSRAWKKLRDLYKFKKPELNVYFLNIFKKKKWLILFCIRKNYIIKKRFSEIKVNLTIEWNKKKKTWQLAMQLLGTLFSTTLRHSKENKKQIKSAK